MNNTSIQSKTRKTEAGCIAPPQKKPLYTVWLIGILILVAITYFGLLDQTPSDLHIDEAGMAVSAYDIAEYGVGSDNQSFPVYFYNFFGGQSAMYVYLCAGLIKLFGLSMWTIRLPGAIMGVIFFLFGSLIIRERIEGKTKQYIGMTLMAIMPYFIMRCRIGLDCNLFLSVSTIAIYLTLLAFKTRKCRWYLMAGLLWGLTLYTYALSYLAVALFLIVLLIYLIVKKQVTWKQTLCVAGPIVALAWPLILFIIINTFDLPEIHLGAITIGKLYSWRGSEIGIGAIFINIARMVGMFFIGDETEWNVMREFGVFYLLTPFFSVYGFIRCIKSAFRRNKKDQQGAQDIQKQCYRSSMDAVFIFFTVSVWVICLLLSDTAVNINRSNGIYFCIFIMALVGLFELFEKIKKKEKSARKELYKAAIVAIVAFYAVNFAMFGYKYVTEFAPDEYHLYTGDLSDVFETEVDLENETTVYWDLFYPRDWKYFLLNYHVDPAEFNENTFMLKTENHESTSSIKAHLKKHKKDYAWRNVRFGIEDSDINTDSVYIVMRKHKELIDKMKADDRFILTYDKDYLVFRPINQLTEKSR